MGLPAGIGTCSPLSAYINQSGRGVVVALARVSTTTSVLIMPPLILRDLPGGTANNPQSPPPLPLLCGRYTLPSTVVLPLSEFGPRSSFDPSGGGGMLLCKSSVMTLTTSIVA